MREELIPATRQPEREWTRGHADGEDGIRIAYWIRGRGPALLLIAGQSLGHRAWVVAADRLQSGRRVLVYDHRGVGASGVGPLDRITTRSMAGDASAVLAAAGVDRADVVGHSMGGRIAQWLAIDHPEQVDRLVLAATTCGDRHGPARAPAVDAALRSGDAERIAPLFFGEPGRPELRRLLTIESTPAVRGRLARASREHDTAERVAAIGARTLVLHGADDAITPVAHGDLLASRIPDAAETVLPDGVGAPRSGRNEEAARGPALLSSAP